MKIKIGYRKVRVRGGDYLAKQHIHKLWMLIKQTNRLK